MFSFFYLLIIFEKLTGILDLTKSETAPLKPGPQIGACPRTFLYQFTVRLVQRLSFHSTQGQKARPWIHMRREVGTQAFRYRNEHVPRQPRQQPQLWVLISSSCFPTGDSPSFFASSAVYLRECGLYYISTSRLL